MQFICKTSASTQPSTSLDKFVVRLWLLSFDLQALLAEVKKSRSVTELRNKLKSTGQAYVHAAGAFEKLVATVRGRAAYGKALERVADVKTYDFF